MQANVNINPLVPPASTAHISDLNYHHHANEIGKTITNTSSSSSVSSSNLNNSPHLLLASLSSHFFSDIFYPRQHRHHDQEDPINTTKSKSIEWITNHSKTKITLTPYHHQINHSITTDYLLSLFQQIDRLDEKELLIPSSHQYIIQDDCNNYMKEENPFIDNLDLDLAHYDDDVDDHCINLGPNLMDLDNDVTVDMALDKHPISLLPKTSDTNVKATNIFASNPNDKNEGIQKNHENHYSHQTHVISTSDPWDISLISSLICESSSPLLKQVVEKENLETSILDKYFALSSSSFLQLFPSTATIHMNDNDNNNKVKQTNDNQIEYPQNHLQEISIKTPLKISSSSFSIKNSNNNLLSSPSHSHLASDNLLEDDELLTVLDQIEKEPPSARSSNHKIGPPEQPDSLKKLSFSNHPVLSCLSSSLTASPSSSSPITSPLKNVSSPLVTAKSFQKNGSKKGSSFRKRVNLILTQLSQTEKSTILNEENNINSKRKVNPSLLKHFFDFEAVRDSDVDEDGKAHHGDDDDDDEEYEWNSSIGSLKDFIVSSGSEPTDISSQIVDEEMREDGQNITNFYRTSILSQSDHLFATKRNSFAQNNKFKLKYMPNIACNTTEKGFKKKKKIDHTQNFSDSENDDTFERTNRPKELSCSTIFSQPEDDGIPWHEIDLQDLT